MSRFWDCVSFVVFGLFDAWREYFQIPASLRLPGPSAKASESWDRIITESLTASDVESLIPESLPASDHFQNGCMHEQEYANLWRKIEELQEERSCNKALIAGLEDQLKEERSRNKALIAGLEDQLKEENGNSSSRIEELQRQLQGERTRYEAEMAGREIQFQQSIDNLSGSIEELGSQFQGERHRYEQRIAELEDQLERLKDEIAAQAEEIQKLVKQLELAERQNSHDFAGGESFLDSGATPHLLNKAVERVNQTSGIFTKLLMSALMNGGVDCAKVAKALAPSVSFERPAHTKYVYQALICKVLFIDFESECFNIEDNAPESLDPEQLRKENFQRYQQLIVLENPEDLVYEDETDSDFRRFCNKKQKDLISTLSLTGAPGVGDVAALILGEVFGPDGIRKQDSAGTQSQIKVSSTFVKFALSVFLVHKLSFSLHPIARIYRVKVGIEFLPQYMEPVVASADSDDEDTDSVSLNGVNCTSPGRTSRGTRNIINQHLRTIRVLEERLAVKENDVKSKDEALKEATEDLARDERIFAEKMKEIKALRKLARDLSNEKDALVQKAEKDAAIISRMSEQALAKEDELGRLRMSLENLESGRPDAFVMNGACVPGVPIAVANPKRENGDSHVDNSENTDEATSESLEIATNVFHTFSQARLEDSSDKMKVEEEGEMLSEEKVIEEQKQHLEEDVRVQTREFKRSKQKGSFLSKYLCTCSVPSTYETSDSLGALTTHSSGNCTQTSSLSHVQPTSTV